MCTLVKYFNHLLILKFIEASNSLKQFCNNAYDGELI